LFAALPCAAFSPLSLHDALPILSWLLLPGLTAVAVSARLADLAVSACLAGLVEDGPDALGAFGDASLQAVPQRLVIPAVRHRIGDRKSTRLNSSHRTISYAVFCL